MISARLRELAERAGMQVEWQDVLGQHQVVSEATVRALLTALGLPCHDDAALDASLASLDAQLASPLITAMVDEPITIEGLPGSTTSIAWHLWREDGSTSGGVTACHDGRCSLPAVDAIGYHTLDFDNRKLTVAVAPRRCWSVADACRGDARIYATSTQLYALRRAGGSALGSGDFGALEQFCKAAGATGVDAVAISPVHAGFAADGQRYSPYAPSTRLFTNVLAIDPAETFGAAAVAEAIDALSLADTLRALEDADLIDWPAVATARLAVLRHLVAAGLSPALDGEFVAWREKSGDALEFHARFEALHAIHAGEGQFDWRSWPAEHRQPDSDGVRRFALEHADEVRFHAVLQWLAARGFDAAQQSARDAGMRVGLIGDLAVGTDPSGSHGWSRQGELLDGVSVGAPPDALSPLGQDWGLTAFSPKALRDTGYRAFIELLRASFASVGGLRIDHVLGLARLWLIPSGAGAREGAYLRFPFDDMARLVALESWRHRAIVVGENLGTVPAGFNDQLASTGILGMDVLWFKRDWQGDFVDSSQWTDASLATTTTHDLPTVEGWWAGREIDWRVMLDQLGPNESEAGLRRERHDDRIRLARSIGVEMSETAPLDAVIEFVARAPTSLALIPIEDLLGLVEQPNLPGTSSGHPNWQRRLPCRGTQCFDSPVVARRIERLKTARGHR